MERSLQGYELGGDSKKTIHTLGGPLMGLLQTMVA
jgi:hypothetical protein